MKIKLSGILIFLIIIWIAYTSYSKECSDFLLGIGIILIILLIITFKSKIKIDTRDLLDILPFIIFFVGFVLMISISAALANNIITDTTIEEVCKIVIDISGIILGFSFVAITFLIDKSSRVKNKSVNYKKSIRSIINIIVVFSLLVLVGFFLFVFVRIPTNPEIFNQVSFGLFTVDKVMTVNRLSFLLYFFLILGFIFIFIFLQILKKCL